MKSCWDLTNLNRKMCPGNTLEAFLFALNKTEYAGICTCHPLSGWRVENLTTFECVPREARDQRYFLALAVQLGYFLLCLPNILSRPISVASTIECVAIVLECAKTVYVCWILLQHPHEINWDHALTFWLLSSVNAWVIELSQIVMEARLRRTSCLPPNAWRDTLCFDGSWLLIFGITIMQTWVARNPRAILLAIGLLAFRSFANVGRYHVTEWNYRDQEDKKVPRYFRQMAFFNVLEGLHRLLLVYLLLDIPRHHYLVNLSYLIGIFPSILYVYILDVFLQEVEVEEEEREEVDVEENPLREKLLG